MLLLEYYWPLLRLVLRFKSAHCRKRNNKMKIISVFQFKKVIRLRFKTITLAAFAVALLSLANCTSFQQDSPFDITGTNYHPPTISATYDTTVFVGDVVHLHSTGSADNGSIRSYEWSFGNGTTITTAADDFDTAFSTAGQQTVSVVAVDNNGVTSEPATITVAVQNKPALAVSSSSISMGSNSNSATFSITNAGGGTLQWTISSNATWLTVSPANGSTTTIGSVITVTANTTNLASGSYTGNITVTSGGISKVIAVTMTVTQVLAVSTTSILLGSNLNSGTFTITNAGQGTLQWSISTDASWLTVSQMSGSTTTSGSVITIIANRKSLLPGTYTGNITITAQGNSKVITVTISKVGYSYTIFNSTDAPMKFWINNIIYDTIPVRDSVTISYNPATYPVYLYFEPIVSTMNNVYWSDTIRSAQNFYRKNYVDNTWFLLRLTNNTDRTMSTVVVRNTSIHDSSSVYLPIGATQNIGFYPSGASTYIATYYYNATRGWQWSSLNTVNTINDALLENLTTTGSDVN